MFSLPSTYSRYLRLSLVALALSTVAFLSYQAAVLWYQGSAYSSLYAQRPLPKVKALGLRKGEVFVEVPCVNVRAIQQSSVVPKTENAAQTLGSQSIQPTLAEGIAGLPQGVGNAQLLPRYPLLLGRYTVKAPVLTDLLLEARLDSEGILSVTPAPLQEQPRASLFEMGRLRELGLWVGQSAYDRTAQAGQSKFGWDVALSYQHDLFRFASIWTRLRAEAGYSQNAGFEGKIQVGIPVVRF